MAKTKYNRVLLKLNGEALAGEAGWGIDVPTVEAIAAQIHRVHDLEVQMAIVIGAGNIWRGINGLERGMERATADYMGMLATVINTGPAGCSGARRPGNAGADGDRNARCC
jgi:uridylate kinase